MRLRPADPPAATLALVAAVALEEALAWFAPAGSLSIKWPNDLLLGGAKLAGILLERIGDAVVIGFGANLAEHPEGLDQAATSLAVHGTAPEPALVAETLAEGFARWLRRWRGEGLEPVRARWLERAHPVGTGLRVRCGEAVLEGLFEGLDRNGALILRLADGSRHVMHAGDVFLI